MMKGERFSKLWDTLESRHGIHNKYYPSVDLEDLPRGPLSEVENICHQLEENSLPCVPENILLVMETRRELLVTLGRSRNLREKIGRLSRDKTGFTGVPLYSLAILLTPLVLFGTGFFMRLGQRFADSVYNYLVEERGMAPRESEEIAEALIELEYEDRKTLLKFRAKKKWKRKN